MLTNNQTNALAAAREFFYMQDIKYGEVFDSNFIDALTFEGINFTDCISTASKDTEQYIFLEEHANHGITTGQSHGHLDS